MKILVIGGSSGLGLSTINLLKNKHEVFHAGLDEVKDVQNYSLDLRDNQSIATFADKIKEEHSDIDCVIHSAGLYQSTESIDISDEEIDMIFSVNTTGIMKVTNKLLPVLEKNKGLLVVIGSVNVHKHNHLIYTPSKCALQAYVEYLQNSYRENDLRISIVNPGLMDTQLFENAGATRDKSKAMQAEDVARVIEQIVENTTVEISEVIVSKS